MDIIKVYSDSLMPGSELQNPDWIDFELSLEVRHAVNAGRAMIHYYIKPEDEDEGYRPIMFKMDSVKKKIKRF